MVEYHNIFGGVYFPGDHDIMVLPQGDVAAPATPATPTPTAGSTQVSLNWADNTDEDFNHYKIYQATASGGPWTEVATSTASQYTVTGLTNNTTYYFSISAVDNAGNESAKSAETSETPTAGAADTTPPAAPTGLAVIAGDAQAALNWDDNTEADLSHYKVYRATVTTGPYTEIAFPTVSNYVATGLVNGTEYFFVVTAVDTSGNESAESTEESDTPTGGAADTTAPAVPTGLAVVSAGDQQITLNWTDNGEGDFANYKVERATNGAGPWTEVAVRTTSDYIAVGLTNGTQYFFRVNANDLTGNASAFSSSVNATPVAATVPTSATFGAANYGTAFEPATTTGTQVSSLASITATNTVYLLNAGTYTGTLTIPAGSTVKPYNGGVVHINGVVNFNNGTTLAGISVEVSNQVGWASRITSRSNVMIRHCKYRGGKHEAIRIDGNSQFVTIRDSDIDGGYENHTVKVNGEGGTPSDISFINNKFSKLHFNSASEDLLQIEFWNRVTVDHCTFRDNPNGEDGFDVKTGNTLRFTNNLIEGSNINAENILVAGNLTDIILDHNRTLDGFVSLGAGYLEQTPTWIFRNTEMVNGTLRVRKSFSALHTNNKFTNTTIQLGTFDHPDDFPRNPTFTGNTYISCTFKEQQVSGLTKDW